MTANSFQCFLVESAGEATAASLQSLKTSSLPAGEVTIQVAYSSLNYKDALAVQGHRGIVKRLPHVPGIDAAGTVVASESNAYQVGDEVIVTGNDLGQGHWGGWAQLIRVPAEWIVPLPKGLSLRESMILGTAGFTAAQCVLALQRNEVQPHSGPVVVTGATGGVGSLAVNLLAKLGYEVVAVTGKSTQHDFLASLGAARIADRAEVIDESTKPMLSTRWAGAVDTVGGSILRTLVRTTRYGGCIAMCGLVAGVKLDLTVYPFLLRGINLCGVASADCPYSRRREIWNLLAGPWKPHALQQVASEVALDQVGAQVQQILDGGVVGRTLLKINQPN